MDEELIQAFLEEVLSYLPAIRGGIAAARAGEDFAEKLTDALRYAHTIKGAAMMVGFAEVGATAESLEKHLRKISEANQPVSEEIARELLAQVDVVEARLDHAAVGSLQIEDKNDNTDIPRHIADNIHDVADTSYDVADGLRNVADTSRNVADTSCNIADTIRNVAETSCNVAETSCNVADTIRNVADASRNIAETRCKVADSPRNVAETPRNVAETSRNVAINAERQEKTGEIDIDELAEQLFPSFDDGAFTAINYDDLSLPDPAEVNPGSNFAVEEFEIDEEMLDIFAVEAEELLRVVRTNLENLAENPNNRESLWEIRRAAHTLKGSAAIVGLQKLAGLAHRVEDLLDFLAEHEIAGNGNVFEVLLTAADCLSAIAGGDDSIQVNRKIERLGEDFAATLALLQKKAAVEDLPAAANLPTAIPGSAVAAAENSSPTVRVSLERLDELVNLIGEMVIIRSTFEQRLADFAAQNEELRNNARRLQNSTAKLEIEFEADAPTRRPAAVFQTPAGKFDLTAAPEFDALEFDNYTEFYQTTRDLIETAGDASAIGLELDALQGNLEILFDRQYSLVGEMQDKLLRLRMVNFGSLANRLHRTARVTAEQESKQVELVIENENLEINTQILDALVEPLLHLLRNAVAHGIETADTRRRRGKSPIGKITLRPAYEGMYLTLTVSDDGRGIAPAALRQRAIENNLITAAQAAALTDEQATDLIFLPGLTTSETISEVAGRGIGLSIVKTGIERQRGTVTIASENGRGTTFTIRLPLPSAITRALLVKSGGRIFALPLGSIKHIGEADSAENTGVFNFENVEYKIAPLAEFLELPPIKKTGNISLLLVETEEKRVAVAVEEVLQTEEIVVRPLDGLAAHEIYTGATILGDGGVVPVLNLSALFAGDLPAAETVHTAIVAEPAPKDFLTILIVDDSPSVRTINSKMVKNAGWQPLVAKDGLEALDILQAFHEPPDIILTDVEMPKMNGYELLAAIRQQEKWQTLPIVMITSRSGDKHRQKAFDLGVNEYVVKPYRDAHLLEIIKNLVGRK